eukprot:5029092-Prymnesium_polylepis.1
MGAGRWSAGSASREEHHRALQLRQQVVRLLDEGRELALRALDGLLGLASTDHLDRQQLLQPEAQVRVGGEDVRVEPSHTLQRVLDVARLDRGAYGHALADRLEVDARVRARLLHEALRRLLVALNDEVVHHEA